MRFFKWAIVIVLIILPLAEVAGHFVVQQTDAYQVLVDFIKSSAAIKEKVGDRPKMRLHVFGYSIRVIGPSGRAEFSASIEGSRGTGELYASLAKKGDWKIASITLNGQEVRVTDKEEAKGK